MTATTQTPESKSSAEDSRSAGRKTFFRGIRPMRTRVSAPGATARKMLQTRRRSSSDVIRSHDDELASSAGASMGYRRKSQGALPQTPLPEEARELKAFILATVTQPAHRFSFSRMRRMVVPPVQIPESLDIPGAVTNLVAGSKIPMTKAMWTRHREKLVSRLPRRVDEAALFRG